MNISKLVTTYPIT